jgi:mono/diheme cytochrome c family protein
MARRAVTSLLAVAVLATAGCGSESVHLDPGESRNIQAGAQLFAERCSGCHTLAAAGTEGSAVSAGDKETTDGPNLNDRRVDVDGALYAIRNGGFSGAIMPENIVTGQDAENVAQFLAKYAGRNVPGATVRDAGDTSGE